MILVRLDQDRQFIFELPYNLTLKDLAIDRSAEDVDLEDQLGWLYDNVNSDEMGRIMTSALILHAVIVPKPPLADCLATAIVWERG